MAFNALRDERRVELILAKLLRVSVIVSALVVLAGGILYEVRHGRTVPQYHVFLGEPASLRSVTGIVGELASFHSRSIIQFGLLLLLITPVTWVSFLFISFLKQRDVLYSIVTLIVIGILIYSVAGGQLW
jgi:uncharacterized membrane protein